MDVLTDLGEWGRGEMVGGREGKGESAGVCCRGDGGRGERIDKFANLAGEKKM